MKTSLNSYVPRVLDKAENHRFQSPKNVNSFLLNESPSIIIITLFFKYLQLHAQKLHNNNSHIALDLKKNVQNNYHLDLIGPNYILMFHRDDAYVLHVQYVYDTNDHVRDDCLV